jgi:hypothetical protein
MSAQADAVDALFRNRQVALRIGESAVSFRVLPPCPQWDDGCVPPVTAVRGV